MVRPAGLLGFLGESMTRKMTSRIDVVEERLERLETSMAEMKRDIMMELKSLLEKREDESQTTGSNEVQELEEFRLSAKKVELPAFDGWDPVAWITRAEMYFDVQRTSEEVRIKLAKLSMDGPTSIGSTCGKSLLEN